MDSKFWSSGEISPIAAESRPLTINVALARRLIGGASVCRAAIPVLNTSDDAKHARQMVLHGRTGEL